VPSSRPVRSATVRISVVQFGSRLECRYAGFIVAPPWAVYQTPQARCSVACSDLPQCTAVFHLLPFLGTTFVRQTATGPSYKTVVSPTRPLGLSRPVQFRLHRLGVCRRHVPSGQRPVKFRSRSRVHGLSEVVTYARFRCACASTVLGRFVGRVVFSGTAAMGRLGVTVRYVLRSLVLNRCSRYCRRLPRSRKNGRKSYSSLRYGFEDRFGRRLQV
jgi:hypothetical protein